MSLTLLKIRRTHPLIFGPVAPLPPVIEHLECRLTRIYNLFDLFVCRLQYHVSEFKSIIHLETCKIRLTDLDMCGNTYTLQNHPHTLFGNSYCVLFLQIVNDVWF